MPIEKRYDFQAPSRDAQADLTRRAKAAWFDAGEDGTPGEASGFVLYKGLGYVVLRDPGGVLGVYRVRSDNGMLRRMRRPPKGLA